MIRKKKYKEIKKQRDLFYIFYEHFTDIVNSNVLERKENRDLILRYNFGLLGNFFTEYMKKNCDFSIGLNKDTEKEFMEMWKKIVKEHEPKLKKIVEDSKKKEYVQYIR